MRAAIVLLGAALCACTQMHWVKADVSAEQMQRDEHECEQRAFTEASSRYALYQPMGPLFLGRPGGMAWPSGSVVDPYGYQMLEEYRLTEFCMQSKGYRLEPLPKQQ